MVASGTLYIFTAPLIDIFLVVQIALIARMTLASWDCTDMVCCGVVEQLSRKVAMWWESASRDDMRRTMMNHIIF